MILEDTGIEHIFCATGAEALQILEKEKIDCVCLALYLDDMDGFELTGRIRHIPEYRHTPIVLLTSKNSDEITHQAISAGITDVFSKDNIHEIANFIGRFTEIDKPINGRVLYIEDQKSQRDYVASLLTERSLEVDAFDNAEDALKAFLKNHYHLVITDIVLGGDVSGVLLINKIRRMEGVKGDTPILAITAFDDNSRRISLYHMGITDYITKPIIRQELLARVKNLIKNQKALEREIDFRRHLDSEEAQRRSMKLEALGKLTGGIAHDYNNLLGIIMGYTELLKDEASKLPELMNYIEQIEKATDNGVKLTSKLLAFTRKNAAVSQTVNINDLLEETKPILEKLLTEGISLNLRPDEDLWQVNLDSSDFENALINLCLNAKHAMENSGVLTIMTANTKLGESAAIKHGLPAGEYVRVSIKDTGCGMEKEVVDKIFDPFFTTRGEEGTGLGLSQVYGFMQREHGTVRVESKPGKGTLFSLYFPRESGDSAEVEANQSEDITAPSQQPQNILVVDDEEVLTELTAEILKTGGHHVMTAYRASDALKILSENEVDIVISDVIMPGMNGFELAEKIKVNWPDVKVILVSGYNEQLESGEKVNDYYDVHLEKPVSSIQLFHSINNVLQL